MHKAMAMAIYMLTSGALTGGFAVIANCLVTGEIEATLLCSGALIWSLVGATLGSILGLLSLARAQQEKSEASQLVRL